MTDVVDEQRNQLLRELVWTIVVRAVGHDGRHTVCIVESTDEVVRACLRCRIWRVRIVLGSLYEELLAVSLVVLTAGSLGGERSRNALRVSHLQCTVNLIGRDVVETLALISLRKTLPVNLCRLEQRQGTHHVGMSKSERILDTSIYMTLGSEMDDAIHLIVLHQLQHQVEITDITLYESIVRLVLDVLEVSQVACVSQLVEVDDVILRIFVHKKSYYV